MQRSFRYFIKNGKERKDRSVLLKKTDAQPWIWEVKGGWLKETVALVTSLPTRYRWKTMKVKVTVKVN